MSESAAGQIELLTEVSVPSDGGRRAGDAATVLPEPLLDGVGAGIVVVDEQGRMLFVNAPLARLFGYDRGQLLGRPVGLVIPDQREATHAQSLGWPSVADTARSTEPRLRLAGLRSDGSELRLDIRPEPLVTAVGMWTIATVRHDPPLDGGRRHRLGDLVEEDMRIATELGDTVIRALFRAGLHLQALTPRSASGIRDELANVVDELDQVIRGIRNVVFGLEYDPGSR